MSDKESAEERAKKVMEDVLMPLYLRLYEDLRRIYEAYFIVTVDGNIEDFKECHLKMFETIVNALDDKFCERVEVMRKERMRVLGIVDPNVDEV